MSITYPEYLLVSQETKWAPKIYRGFNSHEELQAAYDAAIALGDLAWMTVFWNSENWCRCGKCVCGEMGTYSCNTESTIFKVPHIEIILAKTGEKQ